MIDLCYIYVISIRIQASNNSMLMRYAAMNFINKSVIYDSYMDDKKRSVITRWRPSNHRLKIELGRYSRPIIPRNLRLCDLCEQIEDEDHVIFRCPLTNTIRNKYVALLENNNDISKILNPNTTDADNIANFLLEIDKKFK